MRATALVLITVVLAAVGSTPALAQSDGSDSQLTSKADKTGTNPINFTNDLRLYYEYQDLAIGGEGHVVTFEVTGTVWQRASDDGLRATSFVDFVEEPAHDAGSNLTSLSTSTPIGVGQFVSDGLSGLAGIGIGVEGSVVGVMSQAEPVPAGDESLAALVQQTNNPIGAAWLLITQNDTILIGGEAAWTLVAIS